MVKRKLQVRIGSLLVLCVALAGCGATAVIPAAKQQATAENAANFTEQATAESALEEIIQATGKMDAGDGSQIEVMLPDQSNRELQWPMLSLMQQTPETAILLPSETILEVENIAQNPELPNGCEITAAAIALNYLGFDVDKVTLSEDYLPCSEPYWDADPNVVFMGDPEDELAFYCMTSPIVTAVNDYLEDVGGEYTAVDISGASVQELYQWIARGTPVLTGYDEEVCYVADPMLEVSVVSRGRFAEAYLERGAYAVVIVPNE